MQKVDVQLEDDLTGGPADETVHFGVDGRAYEIDLNAKHADRFRRQLAPFLERARLARSRGLRTTTRTAAGREQSRQIREWAQHQGLSVTARGRLPASVIEQYRMAHSDAQPDRRPSRARSGRTRRSGSRGGRLSTLPSSPGSSFSTSYAVVIELAEDGGHGAWRPDLPGCVAVPTPQPRPSLRR